MRIKIKLSSDPPGSVLRWRDYFPQVYIELKCTHCKKRRVRYALHLKDPLTFDQMKFHTALAEEDHNIALVEGLLDFIPPGYVMPQPPYICYICGL